LQDWGQVTFKNLTGKNQGQYLVAALLSDDDLNTPHKMPGRLLKGCPNEGPDKDKRMIMCSTSGVFLNRKSEEIWKRSRWSKTEKYKKPSVAWRIYIVKGKFHREACGKFRNGQKLSGVLILLFLSHVLTYMALRTRAPMKFYGITIGLIYHVK
jgi:hypothetical protein